MASQVSPRWPKSTFQHLPRLGVTEHHRSRFWVGLVEGREKNPLTELDQQAREGVGLLVIQQQGDHQCYRNCGEIPAFIICF